VSILYSGRRNPRQGSWSARIANVRERSRFAFLERAKAARIAYYRLSAAQANRRFNRQGAEIAASIALVFGSQTEYPLTLADRESCQSP